MSAAENNSAAATVPVKVIRCSVCMGDDYMAPHEVVMQLSHASAPAEVARQLASSYLPQMAAWTCTLNGALFAKIVYSNTSKGEFDVIPAVTELAFLPAGNEIDCKYHARGLPLAAADQLA